MKRSELKKRLRAESRIFVPEINLPFMQKAEKKKGIKALSFSLAAALLLIISLILTLRVVTPKPALLVLEVNPAFEIEFKAEKVLTVRPLNLDAAFVLEEAEPGESLDEVLEALLRKASELGYLGDEAELSFMAVAGKQKTEDGLNEKIHRKIQALLQKNAWNFRLRNGRAGLEEEAKRHGISPGKMALVKRALAADGNLTLEGALLLSPKELNEIRENYRVEELQEFQKQYRETKQRIEADIEKTLETKAQTSKALREKLKAYKQALAGGGNARLRKEISIYLETAFPGYEFKSRPLNLRGRIEELLAEAEAIEAFFDEAVAEIIAAEYHLFHNEIKEKLKNKDLNFDFEFQKEVAFDQLIKKYRRGLSGREIRIYMLAEQIYALAKENGRFEKRIENLYRQYQKHLEYAGEFRNSDYIKEFEDFYLEYRNKP